jgi:hypothetical protein
VEYLTELLEHILGLGDLPSPQPMLEQLRYISEPNYLQELIHRDLELFKTDYILLSLYELIARNQEGQPTKIWNRLFLLQIRILELRPEMELIECFLVLERAMTHLAPYTSWQTLIPQKEPFELPVDTCHLLWDSLSNRVWNLRTEILLIHMSGFFMYFAEPKFQGLEPFISRIRCNISKSPESEDIWILSSLSMQILKVLEQDGTIFEEYPNFYAEVIRGRRNLFFSEELLLSRSAIQKSINDVGFSFLTSGYTNWNEFALVWIHHLELLQDQSSDVLLIMLGSNAWQALRTEAILFLVVLLKENWIGILNNERTHLLVLDRVLDRYLDRIISEEITTAMIVHLRNHPAYQNTLFIECISKRIGIPTVDEHLLLVLLTQTITATEYSKEVKDRLHDLTLRRINQENVEDFSKFLNSLFKVTTVANVITDYLYQNLHQHEIRGLIRYLLISTGYDVVFGSLMDKFLKIVLDRIQSNSVMEDLIATISDIFKGTLINDEFVDSLVRMDFVGMLIRLVQNLSHQNSTLTFLSYVNLIGKVISYDSKLVHEFVDSEGYTTVALSYIALKETIEPKSFFTPLLFSWRGDYFHILHPSALEFLFQAIDFLDPQSFVSVFSLVLANCSMKNLWNMEQCRRANLNQLILHRLSYFERCNILDQCRNFLVTLLCYHTEFEDVKVLMSMLASKEEPVLGKDAILDILQQVCNNPFSNSPSDFFVLKGPESHFQIPIFPKSCLNTTGYAFVLWFHLTSPNFDLFEFSWVDAACHLRIAVKDARIVILFVENNVHSEIAIENFKLELNKWYSVLFNHKIGMFNIASETLHLDGQLLWKGNVFRSQFHSDLHMDVARQASNIHPITVSSFAFFNQAVSSETLQNLQFTKETSLPIAVELYQFQLLPLSLQPFLFCHPLAVVRDEFCYNLSANPDASPRIALRQIYGVKTRSFADALQCVGSVEILYPLLAVPHGDSILGLTNMVNYNGPSHSFILVIKLLSALVCNSPFHRSKFVHSKGPKLLSLLLQQIPVEYVGLDLLQSILDFRTAASVHPGLAEMIDEHLICEPQIWSRSQPNIQRAYFSRILDMYGDLKKHNLTHWMDSIEQFYGGISKESGSWGFIQTIIGYSLSGEEIERFSESLWCCIHSPEGPRLYDIFEHMYIVNTSFYEAILDYNGVELILRMCQSIHESVRNHALKICNRVLTDGQYYGVALENDILGIEEMMWTTIFRSQPFSRTTYTSFLALALVSPIPESISSVLEFDSREIRYPVFLEVILGLLATGVAEISVFYRVLEDFNYLVGEGFRNAFQLKSAGLSYYLLQCLRANCLEFDSKKELFQQSAVLMIETLFHSENPCLISAEGFTEVASLVFFSLAPSSILKFMELLLDTILERLTLVLKYVPNYESQVRLLH